MDERELSKQRGLPMALRVTVIAITAAGAAAAAQDARADEQASETAVGEDGIDNMKLQGFSCWGTPISRGPAAPPGISEDFAQLMAEVPL